MEGIIPALESAHAVAWELWILVASEGNVQLALCVVPAKAVVPMTIQENEKRGFSLGGVDTTLYSGDPASREKGLFFVKTLRKA